MEKFSFKTDVHVLCVTATTFPEGVQAAFEKVHGLVKDEAPRRTFGISFPQNDRIVYRAAVEQKDSREAERLGCETFLIRKGKYVGETLDNFSENIPEVGRIFQKLLQHPRLDPQGYCLEVYGTHNDVQCMVKIIG